MLRIQLIGSFRAWKEQREITDHIVQIGKADTIVKLLVSHPGQVFTQDQLIQILWSREIEEGKTDSAKSSGNLRRRISALRTLLDSKKNSFGSYILKNSHGYSWNSHSSYWLDTHEFTQRRHEAYQSLQRGQWENAIALYESALELCRGEYLAEDRYAEWTQPLRERWQKISQEHTS
jgi:DNA-binding SARP family transcriptional activator